MSLTQVGALVGLIGLLGVVVVVVPAAIDATR